MVSQLSIVSMVIQCILSVSFPIACLIYFRKKENISFKVVGVGILSFIIFSQILEKGLHVYLLMINPHTSEWLKEPFLFAIYGGLAAGIFEEMGRYLGFSFLLKNHRKWQDGIALGIGHGGIEAILVGAIVGIQMIVFSVLINEGTFDSLLATQPDLLKIKIDLIQTPYYHYWLAGIERIFVVLLHIALSLIVLYGVKSKKVLFLLIAISLHAFVDFFAALYQTRVINLFMIESLLLLISILSVWIIQRSKIWVQ